MKIMLLLKPKPGLAMADFAPHALDEEKAVWPLYKAGIIREMYFQPDPLRVTLIFEAPDVAAVRGHIATFPMIKAELFEIELIQLGPWAQLELLFAH